RHRSRAEPDRPRRPIRHELRGRAEARRGARPRGTRPQAAARARAVRRPRHRHHRPRPCAPRRVRGPLARPDPTNGRDPRRTELTMPVTDVSHDLDALTMTVVAEFAAPPERIWRLWSDPRQTERWWGPPEWPATFIRHDFREG